MRRIVSQFTVPVISLGLLSFGLSSGAHAQGDVAGMYKKNCVLCHAVDGSGNSPSGKALGAKDLRSDEVQKKTDAELTDVITKGKGKMPAMAQKLQPDQIKQLVAYIRALPKK